MKNKFFYASILSFLFLLFIGVVVVDFPVDSNGEISSSNMVLDTIPQQQVLKRILINDGDGHYNPCPNNQTEYDPQDGKALLNFAFLDINNDGIPDEIDDDCADLPYLEIYKSIDTVTNIGAGFFSIDYNITVVNIGGANGQYDLFDHPQYEDDVVINSAVYDSNIGLNGSLLVGTYPWQISNDVTIMAMDTHVYELTLNLFFHINDGVIGDDIYEPCGSGSSSGISPYHGLFNEAMIDVDNDGNVDAMDSVCSDLLFFDLELEKSFLSLDPVKIWDTVTFKLDVKNNGTIDAYNVEISEHIPNGYTFSSLDDNGWTVVNDSLVTQIIPFLETFDSTCLFIDLVVLPGAGINNLTNVAEISDHEDENGDMPEDVDSYPDDNPENDPDEEDDHDYETPKIYDLALKKLIDHEGLVYIGDTVPYMIVIFNQGNMIASNMIMIDSLPDGLIYDESINTDWTDYGTYLEMGMAENLMPGQSDTFKVKLIVSTEATMDNITNYAEITHMEDEFGANMDNFDIDSYPDDDMSNDVGGIPDDITDNHVDDDGYDSDGDGIMDEDDHDPARIPLLICHDLACDGQVNVSLDEHCNGSITAKSVLSEALNNETAYEVSITDIYGNPVDNNFTYEDIGTIFYASVSLPGCGNSSCWGEVLIEDKFPPVIVCPDTPQILNCNDLSSASVPTATENCSAYHIEIIDEVINDLSCNDSLTTQIFRSYVAIDSAGNISDTCVHEILLRRPDLTMIDIPDHLTVLNSEALECGMFPLDNDGNPRPFHTMTGSGTGVPMFDNQPIYPVVPANLCNVTVDYEDQVTDYPCGQRIVRTWTIQEWHCGGDNITGGVQFIEIEDTTAPVFECPDDFTVTTSGYDCETLVTIPSIMVSDLCGQDSIVSIRYPGGFLSDQNGGEVLLSDTINEITYIVYDDCWNVDSCTMYITVHDTQAPFAVCEQDVIVSIPNQGMTEVLAEVFDDGSHDDCGSLTYEVMRPDSTCMVSDTTFGPSVHFCCSDVGVTQMVFFQVTDESGNTNVCMVRVEVQDKQLPTMDCPSDTIIDCKVNYDLNNLGIQFGVPSIMDNCSNSDAVVEHVSANVSTCGIGEIRRTFSLSLGPNQDSLKCTQLIKVENNDAFDEDDIIWPSDMLESNTCFDLELDPEKLDAQYAYPNVLTGSGTCDVWGYNYSDETFDFGQDLSACYKVLRTWKIINWCEQDSDGNYVEFEHEQIFKLNNTIAPTIDSNMVMVIGESFNLDCERVDVSLNATASDDCTLPADLQWQFSIDIDGDGSVDTSGFGSSVDANYPVGIHTIHWTVSDRCGNIDTYSENFEARSVKAPIAVCINGLSTALTGVDANNDGNFEAEESIIWASDFNGGCYHPCGYDIKLSFSSDPDSTSMKLNCDDIGNNIIELWVTDQINGNTSKCITYIEVIDSNDVNVCIPPNTNRLIQGEISRENTDKLGKVEVYLDGSAEMSLTDVEGTFAFEAMPMGGSYSLRPFKNDDPLNGVSTLDLIIIQKHILGLEELNSPYQLIAADVNNNESVSAIDLVELRKLILGVYDGFQNNTSWRFLSHDFDIQDPTHPWSHGLEEEYDIASLMDDMQVDFMGIKIGDVNDTAIPNAQQEDSELRSLDDLILNVSNQELSRGAIENIHIRVSNDVDLMGMQFSLEHVGLELLEITSEFLDISSINYAQILPGLTTFSWHDTALSSIPENEILMTLKVKSERNTSVSHLLKLSDIVTDNEVYIGQHQEINHWVLNFNKLSNSILKVYQNEPNPWSEQTEIKYQISSDGPVQIIIYDAYGKMVLFKEIDKQAGMHSLSLSRSDFNKPGVYFYEISSGSEQQILKMIHLK